jgi:hypothetical protein
MAGLEQDADIVRAVAWITHCAGDDPYEGLKRTARAWEHYHAHCGLMGGRWVRHEPLLLPSDLPGSWVAQAVAFLTKADRYDARQGSRVLPLIKAIGVALPELAQVPGAKERVRRLMADRTRSPESALFELATAGRYLREGMEVAFIPEGSGRTADLTVGIGPHQIHVECKRLQKSDYERDESEAAEALFAPLEQWLETEQISVYLDVQFTVEVARVPADYLVMHAMRAVQTRLALPDGYPWKDAFGQGVVRRADLAAVARDTEDSHILVGPKLVRLLTGQSLDPAKCLLAVRAQSSHEADTRYVAQVSMASVVHWECLAAESVEARARFIKSKLADIDRQVASAPLAITHIGMDAERDSVTADLRRSLNKKAVMEYLAGSRLVEVELHYFLPRELEQLTWAIDEMVDTFVAGDGTSLLSNPRLLPGEDIEQLPPWHIPNSSIF